MRGGLVIIALMLLMACGGELKSPTYPREVAGGPAVPVFKLNSELVLTSDQVPVHVPAAGLVRAVRITYDGSNALQLICFETKSSSVAFEALQKWRPEEGRRASQVGRYFIVAQMEKPDPKTLDTFLTGFEKQLQ